MENLANVSAKVLELEKTTGRPWLPTPDAEYVNNMKTGDMTMVKVFIEPVTGLVEEYPYVDYLTK